MPILSQCSYKPSLLFRSGHLQTLYPTLFRRGIANSPAPNRIPTNDGDFIDLDYHFCNVENCSNLAVLSHGLEGSARRNYMIGMAKTLNEAGWDVICYNFRGCSEEINHKPRLYHSGSTDDLHTVITHGLNLNPYESVALIGFSIGGNQTLKYLGENRENLSPAIKASVTFSVPCDLAESAQTMSHWSNRLYMEYFMRSLKAKIRLKARQYPDLYDLEGLDKMRSFFPFDDKYTAPIHGFSGAVEYYNRCSCKQFLPDISVPSLLVQAQDDPFLPESCYPEREARESNQVHLETPKYGGHAGFINGPGKKTYWMEARTVAFLKEHIPS